MKTIKVSQNTDEWLEARKGRITGSKLKDILVKRGNGRKIGFYQLIADKLAIDEVPIDAMQRGHDLEQEAVDAFEQATGISVETNLGMWVHDKYEDIAISPDGAIKENGKYTKAVEVKCLNSARHLQAIIENDIPYDYIDQATQYFIVNEDLKMLYFVFYDPRLTTQPLHIVEIKREQLEGNIKSAFDYQVKVLEEVRVWTEGLAF